MGSESASAHVKRSSRSSGPFETLEINNNSLNMADSGSDDNEWQPPTEAELKILQARRERSDKISKLMGAYLLKGYKMMGTNCSTCGCILMQDRQKQNYCIACSELDTDTGKDDPVVNQQAARRQVLEERQRQPCAAALTAGSPEPTPTPLQGSLHAMRGPAPGRLSGCPDSNANMNTTRPRELAMAAANPPMMGNAVTPPGVDVSYPLRVLQAKMLQATQDLESAVSMEASIQLCQLIKACAETMSTLHKCNKDSPSPT